MRLEDVFNHISRHVSGELTGIPMTVTELIDTSFSFRYWSYGATASPAHQGEPGAEQQRQQFTACQYVTPPAFADARAVAV